MLKTPVEMILSSRRPLKGVARGVGHTQEVERLKLSALVQLQKQVSPWGVYCGSAKSGEGSGVKLHGTGRSPFVNHLQTPQSGNAHFVRQREKRMGVRNERRESEGEGERDREREKEGGRERRREREREEILITITLLCLLYCSTEAFQVSFPTCAGPSVSFLSDSQLAIMVDLLLRGAILWSHV